jgi:5'-nucleotidase
MNILVTNDDGIHSTGIINLVDELKNIAKIYVFAPNSERSACGHGISIGRIVRAEERDFEGAEMAFAMDGLPADCVKMGADILKNQGIVVDRVFSGINLGGNMGTDAIYSGTISAALEGSICGIPSVAVSMDARKPVQLLTARKLAVQCSAYLDSCEWAADRPPVLSINVPNLPEADIKGIKITGLGTREYNEWYKKVKEDDGHTGYIYGGEPVFYDDLTPDTNDVGASQAGYATVTPLQYDLTNYALLKELRATTRFHL